MVVENNNMVIIFEAIKILCNFVMSYETLTKAFKLVFVLTATFPFQSCFLIKNMVVEFSEVELTENFPLFFFFLNLKTLMENSEI